MESLNIVIPILNEAKNLRGLVSRITKSLRSKRIDYKIHFIDDHSTDNSETIIKELQKKYPITYSLKSGLKGKAYSILQGALSTDAKYVAMIDGDLQYAPEVIPEMYRKAVKENLGVVIGERVKHREGKIRTFVSKLGHLIYGKFLLGMDYDTQSGLKLFKRSIVDHLTVKDIKPWAFDLPLLHTASEIGEKIGSVDIEFAGRKYGKSKINFLQTTWEILATSLRLRFGGRKVFHISPDSEIDMTGAGVIYKKKKFITHTTLHHSKSALVTFAPFQKFIVLALILSLIVGIALNVQLTAIIFIGFLSIVYFLDVFFGLFLVLKSLHFPPEISFDQKRLKRIKDGYLPIYSILCPLYKEASVLPQFVKNIESLDWPKNKLDVLLLLEADDTETIEAARTMGLPEYFRIVVVPDSQPRTKPKACNYGLSQAKGDYVVIYDAEDAPEPEQLKKAFLGFQYVNSNVFCLQAKLNYYNPNQNLLTKLFTAEYSLWFDIVLPGLQTINTTIPLGGTSNHFRTADLKRIEGWDPFNVAEDADLGARLFRQGYKTAIIDSITLEEANSDVKNWIRQRSRWLKGYMQTYLVQMREPVKFAREKKQHYLIFQLVSGLRITFMLINPILWAMTLAYFLLYRFLGPQIEALYPTSVFYMAVFSAVFGNFLYVYYYMIGAAKRGEWGIIKYVFLVPFYWLLTSIGAFVAIYQLIVKPHFWEKTVHGLNKSVANEKQFAKPIEFALFKQFGIPQLPALRTLIKSEYFSGGLLIATTLLANVLNFFYNAYLGRKLDLTDFGLISLVGSFLYIITTPLAGLSRTITYRSGYLFGKYKIYVKSYWSNIRSKSIKISIVLAIIWLAFTPLLTKVFQAHTVIPFIVFVPVWIIGFAAAVDTGFLAGNLFFVVLGVAGALEALVKLLLSVVFVELGYNEAVYLATPLSMAVSFAICWIFILKLKDDKEVEIEKNHLTFPKKFFWSSIINKISTIGFLSLDLVLAKAFLSPEDSGRYAILSLAGKIVFMVGSLFTGFVTPIVSKNEGEGVASEKSFYKLLGIITGASFIAFLGIGVFGHITTPLLFGDKVESIVQFLPLYTFAILMQTVASTIVSYHQVKERHSFSYLSFVFSLVQIVAIILVHRNITDLVWATFIGGGIYLFAMVFLHIYHAQLYTFGTNILDFIGMFSLKSPRTVENTTGLPRVLIFNWRDTKHIWSGGSEVYIQEIAKRLVKKGHQVTVFCGNDHKSPRNERVDGVQIIRRGGFYTVYIWAFLYYTFRLHKYFDVIIDSENGIPFFTPLYANKKIFLLIHHVHQELFRMKLLPPLSWIGKFLEKRIMPIVYRNTEMITVSPSSKADILEHKLTNKEPYVIYNGVDVSVYKPATKSVRPSVLYLGRLTPQKSLTVLINAAQKIIDKIPDVEIIIAGDGEDKSRLMKLTKNIGLADRIKFLGKVTQEEKVGLYQKAWVFVNPSLIEGWGITTIEANACGTPVVASNVAGLRDAVHNPHSGLLVPYGNVDEFSSNIVTLLTNNKIRENMSKESVAWAKKYSWDKSAKQIKEII